LGKSGRPKGFQFSPFVLDVVRRYPRIFEDFMAMRRKAKLEGKARNSYMTVEAFDPKDESKSHDFLYFVRLKGQKFFVKETRKPALPDNPVTQYTLHARLESVKEQLKDWKSKILDYHIGWTRRRDASFLVAEWVPGIPLEKWLGQRNPTKKDEVYQRFLRIERLLKKRLKVNDITTRNVIYNPKTDELTVINLQTSTL